MTALTSVSEPSTGSAMDVKQDAMPLGNEFISSICMFQDVCTPQPEPTRLETGQRRTPESCDSGENKLSVGGAQDQSVVH